MKNLLIILTLLISATSQSQTICNPIITNGLVAYFPFCGNSNDESGNGNHGTVNGASLISDRFGNTNSAYEFSGSGDYIEVTTVGGNFDSQTYSISFWYRTNLPPYTGANPPAIISRSNNSGNLGNVYDNFCIFEGNGLASLNYQSTTTAMGIPTGIDCLTPVNDNTWHLVVLTVDTDSIKSYVDGHLDSTDIFESGIAFQNYPLRFGNSNHTFWTEYNGDLDDIGIWNRALTFQEIDALYNAMNPIASCLIAYYPFTGNAIDSSGNGHDGIAKGPVLTYDRFGNPNSAYYFDGIDDTITLNLFQQSITTYSISAWFLTTLGGPIFSGRSGNGPGITLDVNKAPYAGASVGKITYRAEGSPGISIGQWTDSTYLDSTWHHVVGVYSGSAGAIDPTQFTIYIDGVVASSFAGNAGTAFAPINLGDSCIIGAHTMWNPAAVFGGILDDISVYACALTASDVDSIFNNFHSRINENNVENNFSIYPNPTTGIIHLSGIGNEVVTIFNSLGLKIIQSEDVNVIDISGFPQGIYFAVVKTSNSSRHYNFKITKY